MTIYNFTIIIVGVLFNAIGQLLLKFGANVINASESDDFYGKLAAAINIPIFFGLLCYAISVITWVYALTKVDVSTAYPMLSVGYIVVALLAYLLLGESISTQKIIAMTIIIFGVILISKS